MLYQSTRGGGGKITPAEAIALGLSEDGGLFVPESIPRLTVDMVVELAAKPYKERAAFIMGLFLDDFSAEELSCYTSEAYCEPGFSHSGIAPLHKLDVNTHFLELWHGPTCAFKDMALQILPRLLVASLRKTGEKRESCILVATSGDTGKAALEGFCDVPGTRIMVFYPRDGVSDVQKLQMTTQSGNNVSVVAVEGNFDDTQTGVKAIFSDVELRNELDQLGYFLSSANSINWGRLVPQIAYYVSAYCDLIVQKEITVGDKINFCVPTGNFGNILAAWYAVKMGLPVNKLICASNRNDVLTQFIDTGVYNKNRPFFATASPSMDILVSSNLERLLFELSGKDGKAAAGYMSALASAGYYEIPVSLRNEIIRVFAGGRCSEEDTMKTIAGTFDKYNYLIDTHTAVAYKVLGDYRMQFGDDTPTVVVSTASPFKFCDSVLNALEKQGTNCISESTKGDGVELIDRLANTTGREIPAPLSSLKSKQPRFLESVAPDGMKEAVRKFCIIIPLAPDTREYKKVVSFWRYTQ